MIGIDWGTSSFRAYRLGADGTVIDQIASDAGILHVADGRFAETLHAAIDPWLAIGETRVLMSGMIGSRQGWVEAPYLVCPAGPAVIAANLTPVAFDGASLRIVPGLIATDAGGTPEVMRGEETQIFGARATGLVCLPGSHAKWAEVAEAEITGFETYLSGEAFAALRAGTILGRMMTDAPDDAAAFARGIARSGDTGHLLHQLFGVRTLGLTGQLAADASASYLSGLLIGHEVRAAMPAGAHVTLIGSTALCELYTSAIAALGGTATIGPADAAARGLVVIGELAPWI
jgi:2-dehydro-3-deoxygalactonokinase